MGFSYICLALAAVLCIWHSYRKKLSFGQISDEIASDQLHYILLGILFLLFLFTRFYRLGEVPGTMHIDEYGMLYDAYCLANYQVDRYMVRFPVYLINFGGGQNALYTYLTAIIFSLFGFSVFYMRLAAVLSGALCFIFAYLTGREIVGKRLTALIAPFLVTVLPYFFLAERWGLESHLLASYLTMAVFFVFKAAKTGKMRYYIAAGLSCGITLYTYAIVWMLIPCFMLLVLLYVIRLKKLTWKNALAFVISFAALGWPLLLFLLVNNNSLPEIRTPFFSVVRVAYRGSEISFANILENWNLFFMMVTHGPWSYNAFPPYGTVYIFSVPFILYGLVISVKSLISSVKSRIWDPAAVVVLLFIGVYFPLMLVKGPNVNKINAIYPVFALLILLAVHHLSGFVKYLLPAVAACYLAAFFMFGKYYFIEYNAHMRDFNVDQNAYQELLDFIDKCSEDETVPVYIYQKDADMKARDLWFRTAKGISPYESPYDPEKHAGRYHYHMPDEITAEDNAIYVIDNSISHISSWLAQNGWQRYDGFEGCAVLFRLQEKQ